MPDGLFAADEEGRRERLRALGWHEVWGNHWRAPEGCVKGEEDADHSYQSVPLETAFTIRVKYRLDGELTALPYPLDE